MPRIKICGITNLTDAKLAQRHGDESVSYLREIKGAMIVKVIRVKNTADLKRQVKKYGKNADAFLFDTYSRAARGGTGQCFDWKMLKGIKFPKPFFVAGGIKTEKDRRGVKKEETNRGGGRWGGG